MSTRDWQSDYVTEKARQRYGMPPPVRYTNDDLLRDTLAPHPDVDPASPCLRFLRLTVACVWCRLRRRWGMGR